MEARLLGLGRVVNRMVVNTPAKRQSKDPSGDVLFPDQVDVHMLALMDSAPQGAATVWGGSPGRGCDAACIMFHSPR